MVSSRLSTGNDDMVSGDREGEPLTLVCGIRMPHGGRIVFFFLEE